MAGECAASRLLLEGVDSIALEPCEEVLDDQLTLHVLAMCKNVGVCVVGEVAYAASCPSLSGCIAKVIAFIDECYGCRHKRSRRAIIAVTTDAVVAICLAVAVRA
jgi:hypothetical protein